MLEDGRRLVLKRIVPGGDWLARHTGDQGREGILFGDGRDERFPADLDPATRAAELADGAWWMAMDDVSGLAVRDRRADQPRAERPHARGDGRRLARVLGGGGRLRLQLR